MKRVDTTNINAAGEFSRPTAGAYICVIRNVIDTPDKEYLRITYDIAEGEFKGYYDDLRSNHPDWGNIGSYTRSYKATALPFFKRFCSAVSKSNGNFVFDGNTINADERTLIGKKVGIVFQDEEYYGNDGNKKTRLIVNKEFPIDQIASQKTPAPKKLSEPAASGSASSSSDFMNIAEGTDAEIPFA